MATRTAAVNTTALISSPLNGAPAIVKYTVFGSNTMLGGA